MGVFKFFKLYKWYQIAQRITYCDPMMYLDHHSKFSILNISNSRGPEKPQNSFYGLHQTPIRDLINIWEINIPKIRQI